MADDDQTAALDAMNTIVDAYEAALSKGISPDTVATAALSSALGLMVQIHGEETVAKMVEEIPAKVRLGIFTHK
jgi:hypothetical protein